MKDQKPKRLDTNRSHRVQVTAQLKREAKERLSKGQQRGIDQFGERY